MTTTRIRLATLDMAGTTVDEGGAVYVARADTVAAVIGREVPNDELAHWMGAEKRAAITGLLGALGTDHDEATVDAAFVDFSARLDAAYLDMPPRPIAGAAAAIAAMRAAGVAVYLTTGFSDRVANGLVDGLGWTVGATIDGLAEQVGAGRPSRA